MVYKCGDCDKDYEKKEYLQQHIRLKHPRSVKSVQCVKCDKYFVHKYYKHTFVKHIYPNYTLVHFVGQVLRRVKNIWILYH